jgi:hypothetical protein
MRFSTLRTLAPVRLLVCMMGLLALAAIPDFAWAKDKGWDSRPIAKFAPDSKFSKKVSVDADDNFVLIDWEDGLVRVRVSKSVPGTKVGGAVIALEKDGSAQPTLIKDDSGRLLCQVWLRRQSFEQSTHVRSGQLGTESVRAVTKLFITSSPVEVSSTSDSPP